MISLDNRWRCNVCETLNANNRNDCIVCGLSKECLKAQPQLAIITKRCSFPGCKGYSKTNEKYCDYHYHTVCPKCNKNLKEPNQGFCVECGLSIVPAETRGLSRINDILTIAMVTLSAVLLVLIVIYLFYLD